MLEPPLKKIKVEYSFFLPKPITVHILSFCDLKTIVSCTRVSSLFLELTTDNNMWRFAYYNTWEECILERMDKNLDWKACCIGRFVTEQNYFFQYSSFTQLYPSSNNYPTSDFVENLDNAVSSLMHVKDVCDVKVQLQRLEEKNKVPRWLITGTYFDPESSYHEDGPEWCCICWCLFSSAGVEVQFQFHYDLDQRDEKCYVAFLDNSSGKWIKLFNRDEDARMDCETPFQQLKKELKEDNLVPVHFLRYVGECIRLRYGYNQKAFWPNAYASYKAFFIDESESDED